MAAPKRTRWGLPAAGCKAIPLGTASAFQASADGQAFLQDSWVVHECLGGASNIALAVFDGHGQEGERVSRYVAAVLPGMLAKSSAFKVGLHCSCIEIF
jgi:hypothetical protein